MWGAAVGAFGRRIQARETLRAPGTVHWHDWPAVLLFLVAAVLLFTHLGVDHLWEDEGDTAVLARNILHHGIPVAWDGVNFVAPDYGQRLTQGLVMVSHPWLQYYVTAASFWLFGETSWAARFPFALAGLATIVVAYAMTRALLRSRLAAISAVILLTLSVQFLLFARQARNYSFNALLTCLFVWQFFRLRSWRDTVRLTALGIVLFHAHPIGLVVVGVLALLTLVYTPFRPGGRWFWPAAVSIALYATPWLLWSRLGYTQNTELLQDASQFIPRLLQFAVEWMSVTPLVGLVVLWLVLRARRQPSRPPGRRRAKQGPDETVWAPNERSFILVCVAISVGDMIAIAVTHSREAIWITGLHHAPAMIPLAMMTTGLLLAKVSGRNRVVWVPLMLLFGFTRFAQIVPWVGWAESVVTRDPSRLVNFHVPNAAKDRLLRTTQLHYVRSLRRSNPGVVARIDQFLEAHARPADVVITNFAWEALYFHRRLPQGAKIAPSFPIYSVARAAGLPNYVFGSEGVRWIVWRRAWPAYFPEQDCEMVLRRVAEAGLNARLVSSIQETGFENRENIHFHRFADDTYVFPWYMDLPDVQVYRVETFDETVAAYRQSLRDHPADADTLAGLGVALIATGRSHEAMAVFQQAVDIAPHEGRSQRNLANALLDAGDAEGAASHARLAVASAPDDPGGHDVLGRALAMLGRFDEAAHQFELALDLDSKYSDAREHLMQLEELRRQKTL